MAKSAFTAKMLGSVVACVMLAACDASPPRDLYGALPIECHGEMTIDAPIMSMKMPAGRLGQCLNCDRPTGALIILDSRLRGERLEAATAHEKCHRWLYLHGKSPYFHGGERS